MKRLLFCAILSSVLSAGLIAKPISGVEVTGVDTSWYLSGNEIKKGERLFFGLLPTGTNAASCISCHNVSPAKEFSWNPSAKAIAEVHREKPFEDFRNLMLNPVGNKMAEVHEGYQLDDTQLLYIKAYLQEALDNDAFRGKPDIWYLLYNLSLFLLLILALGDLIFFKKIPFKAVHLLLVLIAAVLLTRNIVQEAIALGRQEGYMPDQPIKFSHLVHSGIEGIDCMYCHSSAEHSKSADIPSMNVCWNCHSIVREGSRSGRFEINKIVEAWDSSKTPIEWIKVHNLPDHVYFSHAQHVGAGKLDCAECHGPVKNMEVVQQHTDLSMGWCLDCHRSRKVQFVDNEYYQVYKDYHEKLKKGEMDSILVDHIGGSSCQKCHY